MFSRSLILLSLTLLMTVHLSWVDADNLNASLYIWWASSLVGQSTRALGPPDGAPSRCSNGTRKAAVLPEPVGAHATIWRPWNFNLYTYAVHATEQTAKIWQKLSMGICPTGSYNPQWKVKVWIYQCFYCSSFKHKKAKILPSCKTWLWIQFNI